MATQKNKKQFNVWIDPEIAQQPIDLYNDLNTKGMLPRQGGYSKLCEMVVESGSKVVREVFEKKITETEKK
jgi:hypothetical protein